MEQFDDLEHDPDHKHGPERPELPELDDELDAVPEGMTVAGSLSAATLKALFQNRNFLPLWMGQLVSYIGDQFFLIAVLSLINGLSGTSTGPLILFAVAFVAPQIVFGLISGVLVDKQDRKRVMMGSDLVRAASMFALILISGDPSRLWILYLAALAIGSAQMLFYPARASALTAIVNKRDLAGANALLEAGFVVALIFGSGAAGILVEKFGAGAAFAFNGGAFLFSTLMIFLIRIPKHRAMAAASEASSFRQVWLELRQGLSYVWHTHSMRYIMGLNIMVSGGLGAVIILVLDYLNKVLNIGPSGFGAVIAILGVGVVVGGILIQRLSKFLPTNRLVGLAMATQGLAVGVFVFQPGFVVVLFCTALIGFSLIVARAVLSTLTQAIPPEEYRGRVQSTFNLISQAPMAAAVGLFGALVNLLNRGLVVGGFSVVMFGLALLATKMLRGIDEAIYSDSN